MNCSCAPSVTTGGGADFGGDISTFRNWIELQQIQCLHYNSTVSLMLLLRSAFTLHPYYVIVIAFDLVNCACTPSAGGSAMTGGSAVTCLHFYISTSPVSARLTAGSGFTLHQYYFIEVDLVNYFCTTSVLFH